MRTRGIKRFRREVAETARGARPSRLAPRASRPKNVIPVLRRRLKYLCAHAQTQMTKTISLSDEAYTVLKRHKPGIKIVAVEPAESSVLLGGHCPRAVRRKAPRPHLHARMPAADLGGRREGGHLHVQLGDVDLLAFTGVDVPLVQRRDVSATGGLPPEAARRATGESKPLKAKERAVTQVNPIRPRYAKPSGQGFQRS